MPRRIFMGELAIGVVAGFCRDGVLIGLVATIDARWLTSGDTMLM
jgi:hypothetical protein